MNAALGSEHLSAPTTPICNALTLSRLTVSYGEQIALWDASFNLHCGSLTAIVGPNGAGKSTLLRASLNLMPRLHGTVHFFDQPLHKVRRRVAYVPQRQQVDWDFPVTVKEVVEMGRYGLLSWWRRFRPTDRQAVEDALEQVNLQALRHRPIGELSGGQQQRVFLARALAQQADLYLMDEPFNGVDAATEEHIVALLQQLRNQGATVVCVHHDLSTAARYFDHAVLLNHKVIAHGPLHTTLTAEQLKATYGVGILNFSLPHDLKP